MVEDTDNAEEPPLEDEAPLEAEPDEESLEGIHELHDPVMREHERPRDGFEPISVWLILLIMALVGWGGWYLGTYSGSFRPDVTDIVPLGEQAGPGEPVEEQDEQPTDLDPMQLGEEQFTECAACHQSEGTGVEGSFPPLVDNPRVLEHPDQFAAILLYGLEGPITADGVEYDGQMPSHGDWTDEELAATMTYVRNSWGNDAEPIDPAFVADVRELTADRTEPWTDPQLRDFFDDIDPGTLGADEENQTDGPETDTDETGDQSEQEPDGG